MKFGCRVFSTEFPLHPLRLTLKKQTVYLLTCFFFLFLICHLSFLPSFRLLPVFVSLLCCYNCLHNIPPVPCKPSTCYVALQSCFSLKCLLNIVSCMSSFSSPRTVPSYFVFVINFRLLNLSFFLFCL